MAFRPEHPKLATLSYGKPTPPTILPGEKANAMNSSECKKCLLYYCLRLDYQPLFVKMSPHPGRIKDRTRETAEIEPTIVSTTLLIGLNIKFYEISSKAACIF